MSGIRLELANPNEYASPKEYVEKHLAPVVTELHRAVEELLKPGASSAEEWAVDMVPNIISDREFQPFGVPIKSRAKHVVFDGSEYFSLPEALKSQKQVKVQLQAVVYVKGPGAADFRLVDDEGFVISNSSFGVASIHGQNNPFTHTQALGFGAMSGLIQPELRTYYLQGRRVHGGAVPVCRRFSLSFIYI